MKQQRPGNDGGDSRDDGDYQSRGEACSQADSFDALLREAAHTPSAPASLLLRAGMTLGDGRFVIPESASL